MSKMYGKERIVLQSKLTHLGNRLVIQCGCDSPSAIRPGCNAGTYAPLGYWYREGDLYYVDLKSREQEYDSVSRDSVACKRLGGLPTKKALREFVAEYWKRLRE
jgi:hypothetical protein